MSLTLPPDFDPKPMVEAYFTEDELGKVLRSHFSVEQQIDYLIKTCSKAKIDGRTNFYTKILILRAMQVPESICSAAENLADVRNNFAHNKLATLKNTKTKIDKFLTSTAVFVPNLEKFKGDFNHKAKGKTEYVEYATGDLGQKLVIAASVLSAIIAAMPQTHRFDPPTKIAVISGLTH